MKNPCKLCITRALCNKKCEPFKMYERKVRLWVGWSGMILFIIGGVVLSAFCIVNNYATFLGASIYIVLAIAGFMIMLNNIPISRRILRRYPNGNTM